MNEWTREDVVIERDGRVRRSAHPRLTMGFLHYGLFSARAECWCGWESVRDWKMRRSAVELLVPHLNECVIGRKPPTYYPVPDE